MDWAIFLGVTALAALATGLVARALARMLARAGREPGFVPVLLAIVISMVVLIGAAKLAVVVGWAFSNAGIDTATALGGQVMMATFAASFVPIAAYVLTFLVVARKAKVANA